jgi:hypothetical protein
MKVIIRTEKSIEYVDFRFTDEVFLNFKPGYTQMGINVAYIVPVENRYEDSIIIGVDYFILTILEMASLSNYCIII